MLSRIRDGTGGDGPLTLAHLHVQRVVLGKQAGVIDPQQHFIMAGRQRPGGGEGCLVGWEEEDTSAPPFPRTRMPCSPGKDPTYRTGADGPVGPVLSEELQDERPSVARSIRVHYIQLDGHRLLAADTGRPLLDHRPVVILVQETDDQRARPCGRDTV